jgi:uncharacterized protein (TIGR02147 family)
LKSIFEFDDYQLYLKVWIKNQPHNGRGEINRLAEYLNVNSTLISQVLSQRKDFSFDQGFKVTQYLGLDESETDFFMTLIQNSRAGTHNYKTYLEKKKLSIRKTSTNLKSRMSKDRELTDYEKATYYSSFLYSAIRLFCDLIIFNKSGEPIQGKTLSEISDYFSIHRDLVLQHLKFLMDCGLIKKTDDIYQSTNEMIFIGRDSTFVTRHHINWRLQCLKKIESVTEEELCFTFPLSTSKKDFLIIREELVKTLQRIQSIAKSSTSEELAFINIDCLKMK